MAGIKSFRISDETKERLELLSASIGGNKDRVFNTLMDTYSLEQEKATVAASDQEKKCRNIRAVCKYTCSSLFRGLNVPYHHLMIESAVNFIISLKKMPRQ